MLKEFNVDILAGSETQCDWRQATAESQFNEIFAPGVPKRSVTGYNITEKKEKCPWDQRGGTAMMALDRVSAHVIDTGADYTGLGRWSWILLGSGDCRTQVVSAYQPCTPPKSWKGFTVFEQHQRYFEPKGDFRSPRTIFYEHLWAGTPAPKAWSRHLYSLCQGEALQRAQ